MEVAPASPVAASGKMWPYRLAVLLLPLMVLWHQDNSLFTPPGQLDSWLYLGFFRDLVNFKRDLFADTYYGSRLSWILPGWLLHSVFPPLFASAVLHLGVLWTAALALFETLRLTSGPRAAFLTALVFCANPQVWNAIGWDYVDGAGIAYCLVTMALLTAAAARPGRRWMLALAGTSIAGLAYSQLVLTAFVPILLLYYAGLAWVRRRPPISALLLDLGLCAGGGFLITTLLLCAINHSLDGTFWFYGPSIWAVTDFYGPSIHAVKTAEVQSRWVQQPWNGSGLVPWLWFTAAAAVTAVIQLAMRLRRPVTDRSAAAALFSMQLLALLAIYAYLQPLRLLGLPFYASYLLPFAFLVIGASFWQTAEQLSQRTYLLICGVAVVVFGTIWYDYAGDWTPTWPAAIWLGAAALAVALLPLRRPLGMLLAIAGFALFTAEVRSIATERNASGARAARPAGPHANRRMLERLMATRARIESVRRNRMVRFWYDKNEAPSEDYTALNATYLMYALGNQPYPQLACDATVQPDTVVAVSSVRRDLAATALGALSECASRSALKPEVVASEVTSHPGGPYTTTLLTLDRDPSRWRHVRPGFYSSGKAVLDLTGAFGSPAFPPDHWSALYAELGTQLHRGPGGITLLTPKTAHAGAALYGPLTALESGRYLFTLRYRAHSGQFAFGVSSGGTWLATDTVGHRAGLDMARECWVDLEKGQEVRIEIANNNSVDVPAALVIRELTAWAIRRK